MSDDITNAETVPLPKAWREGYLAGQRGLKSKDNPYPIPSRDALTWECARSDRLRKRLHIPKKALTRV